MKLYCVVKKDVPFGVFNGYTFCCRDSYEIVSSIGDEMLRTANMNKDRIAMVCTQSNKEYSYELLISLTKTVSANLRVRYDMKKGDVLTVICHNCPEYTIMCFATLLNGGILSTANPAFTPIELLGQLKDNESRFIFCSESVAKSIAPVIGRLVYLKKIFVLTKYGECVSYAELIKDIEYIQPQNTINIHKDIAFLLYSSGTTGLPKGVLLTHFNILSNIMQFSHPRVQLEDKENVEQEVYIAALPLFHAFGLLTIQLYGLIHGCKIVYLAKYSMNGYISAISLHKATILHLVPPIITNISQSSVIRKDNFTSVHLAYTGGAPISKETTDQFLKVTGIPKLRNGYGMTEAGPVLTASPRDGSKSSSVGLPLPYTQAKVIDISTKETLQSNQAGELLFKGPQIMKGYLKNEKATKAAKDDEGWLHTGDIGYYDDDGVFYIVDRIKDLIKYKVHQISPFELESVIISCPGVREVAVIGVPHTIGGEAPLAFIVKDEYSTLSENTVHNFLRDKVAPHKFLRGGVIFVSSLPKSPSGKILKKILRQQKSKL